MINDLENINVNQNSSSSDLLKTQDFSAIDDFLNHSNDFIPSKVGISCFPSKVDFSPIYPNSISHQKILVINTGIKSEYISIKIEGNQFPFTINANGATLEPGSSKSVIISYRPLKPREYSTYLIIEGKEKLIVPIAGSCLHSPIEIPSELDSAWSSFSKKQLSAYVPIKNNSKKESFHIEISTNCPPAFKVFPESIDIEPESSEHVTIQYSPNQSLEKIPHFHMKCEATGDLITRVLKVLSLVFINFGAIIVGKSSKKKANVANFGEAPEVKLPFSSSVSNDLFFSFHPTESGTFHETLQIGDNQIELMGEGVSMPFSFNRENYKVQNITNDMISLSFSLDNKATIVPQKSELQSRAWTFLNFEKGKATTLSITYHRNEDEIFTWQFELPKPKSPTKQIQVDETLFPPKQDTLFPESDLIVTHPSFISFFQSNTESSFIVTGVDHFEADGPMWLRFPSEVDVDSPISVELKKNVFFKENDSEIIADKIIIQSETSLPHELPIIGYKGQSDISCVEKSVLTYALDDHYVTQIEVKNCGDIAGFATFTASDRTRNNVRVHPSAAIIEPDCTQLFEFIVDSKPQPGLSVPVLLYTCDEIMREIRSLLYSEDFFGSDVPIDANEVIQMRSVFTRKNIKKKEFNSIFKKLLCSKEIELYTFEKSSPSLKRLAVFPLQIESFVNYPNKFSIINMSSTTIATQIHSQNRLVSINPLNAVIKGYSEVSVNIKLLGEVNSFISIEYEDDTINVPVKSVSSTPSVRKEKKKKMKMIKIDPKFLDFGICYVGQPPRKANVKVTNLSHKKLYVTLQPKSRNWKFPSKVFTYPLSMKLPPFSTSEFIVEFSPPTALQFEETVFVEIASNETEKESHKLLIHGNGVSKKHDNFIGSEVDNLSFPPCELGRIQRGRVRIMNQRDQKCNIVAYAEFPFICPVPRFSIEPNCYVLCPIHFSPKSEGKFTGFATFESDISETFKIKVNGVAILPN